MTKIRCCVVDDEPLALELIAGYVKQTPFLQLVNTFASASQAIKTIISDEIDIVFLDIQMAELNGIEFAKVVPPSCRIIFITAFEKYALEGFRANALDYLVKPVSYNEFLSAANKALKWVEMNRRHAHNSASTGDFIIIKSEYKMIQIAVKDILYIEGLKDYVKIYLESQPQPILSLVSLKVLENKLPESIFLRVHRSFVVNTTKIRLIDRNRIVFGKQYIPVSETYKAQFAEYVARHSVAASPREES